MSRCFSGGRARAITLLLLAATGAAPAFARGEDAAARVSARLQAWIDALDAPTTVGIDVREADSGKKWFSHQAQTPLKPASVRKLFVSAAALERFGPGFTYRTVFLLKEDELWVIGSGDPGLGDERIEQRHGRARLELFKDVADALTRRGVDSLAKIVLDDSIFDATLRNPDWPADQYLEWYQAPIAGINLNDNCLDAAVSIRAGRPEVATLPALGDGFVRNELRVAEKHQPLIERAAQSDVFHVRGTIARGAALRPASVYRPTLFFGNALRTALAARGIPMRGSIVRRRITPAAQRDAKVLLEHETSLPDVLWRCNNHSQNLFAECLLKSLAAYDSDGTRTGEPGSWDSGLRIERDTLARLGLDVRGVDFHDGSGLSHTNRVTPEQVVNLLRIMSRHRNGRTFLESLAVSGRPGSLQTRYLTPAVRGRLRGKTGTISGVRSLAGFLTRRDGTRLVFAVLINKAAADSMIADALHILAGGAPDSRPGR